MTRDENAHSPNRLRRILKVALFAVAGLVLLLLGLLSISMCGPNRHVYGALAGALGGALIAIARRAKQIRWFALAGGVLGAELVVGLMAVLHGTGCDDLLLALQAGLFVGLGIGLLVDGMRPAAGASGSSSASSAGAGGDAA